MLGNLINYIHFLKNKKHCFLNVCWSFGPDSVRKVIIFASDEYSNYINLICQHLLV